MWRQVAQPDSEGSSVTLTCSYTNKIAPGDDFFWYQQNPGKPPEFIFYLKSCCVLSVLLSVPGKTMQLLLFSCMMMIFCLQPGESSKDAAGGEGDRRQENIWSFEFVKTELSICCFQDPLRIY
uniref:Immunoglobulin V-set domain-containing protein n=1 Tax=Xiphophorus maculatus TaxID=8083 RepID=A0A3B5R6X7_XIPMA